MVSTKSLHFSVCAHIYGSGCLYSILAVHVRWGLFYGRHLVCSSRPVSLLVQVPHESVTSSGDGGCDAALSRTVRKIFSSLWQSVWKITIAHGGLYFLSVSIPVGLL